MEKKSLLSIGKIAKLTGVNIKSLRYYDQLGILRPAYIDEDSKYRYYTFSQVYIVEAIQLCVELDIPLKQFSDFLADEGHQINYLKLLDFGSEIAKEKIMSIQNRLNFLEEGKRFIAHAEEFSDAGLSEPFRLPAMNYIALPINGKPTMEKCYEQVGEIFMMLQEKGLTFGFELGLLAHYKKGEVNYYAYVDADIPEEQMQDFPNLLRMPESDYVSLRTGEEGAILRAPELFQEQFNKHTENTVMQNFLFMGMVDTDTPMYELRCTLPPDM